MDINFHYFAVKACAAVAGFAEPQAQQIAAYSQFVDDYDLYKYIAIREEPPAYARNMATNLYVGYSFNPATTGFNGLIDKIRLARPADQKWIVKPFHFITMGAKMSPDTVANRSLLRTTPAEVGDNSLISKLLKDARDCYHNGELPEFERVADRQKISLMRIGMLLHIFADTFSHQNYSGYWGWENHSKLLYCENNINNAETTKDYKPETFFRLASIGHCNTNVAPDDSNVTFRMEMKSSENDDYTIHYGRSNTTEFLTAIFRIVNFLRSCLGKEEIGQDSELWMQDYLPKFRAGLLTAEKGEDKLAAHWKQCFPNVEFHYSTREMIRSLLPDRANNMQTLEMDFEQSYEEYSEIKFTPNEHSLAESMDANSLIFDAVTEDFFLYNALADRIRVAVNGEKYS